MHIDEHVESVASTIDKTLNNVFRGNVFVINKNIYYTKISKIYDDAVSLYAEDDIVQMVIFNQLNSRKKKVFIDVNHFIRNRQFLEDAG